MVAIKELLRNDIQSADVRLFSREISILRKLRSEHIVQFKGFHFAPPRFCIVMEYMSKGALRKVIADRLLPEDRRITALLVLFLFRLFQYFYFSSCMVVFFPFVAYTETNFVFICFVCRVGCRSWYAVSTQSAGARAAPRSQHNEHSG